MQSLLFFNFLGRLVFTGRLVSVFFSLFFEVGFEFLAVDFAVLVGIDLGEVIAEGGAFELIRSQSAVGVFVQVVELRTAVRRPGSRRALATLIGQETSRRFSQLFSIQVAVLVRVELLKE